MNRQSLQILIATLALAGCKSTTQPHDAAPPGGQADAVPLAFPIVATGQSACYDAAGPAACPGAGGAFFGQDAQYAGNAAAYRDNGDGTVSDLVTGLTWSQAVVDKVTLEEAHATAAALTLGGHGDWRVPTIKELYSLIDFDGGVSMREADSVPFIDTDYFEFEYGDVAAGERLIDAQYWSATVYVSTTMGGDPTAFGVNFADGRVKGYPIESPRGVNRMFIRYVRSNPGYGQNDLVEVGDGTVEDRATGLIWQQGDSGEPLSWREALAYCEALELAGDADWRLPDAKALQSIVDYDRAPTVTRSAAIDPVFTVSEVEAYYWSSTTHQDGPVGSWGDKAAYVSFGRAMGFMRGQWMDVHGAGAQRSDPKVGDPDDYPEGHGPQGDDIRVFNYARCVRGGAEMTGGPDDPGPDVGPPDAGPPDDERGPPAEAIAACDGSSAGDDCGFTSPRGDEILGRCEAIQGAVACVPDGGPGQ